MIRKEHSTRRDTSWPALYARLVRLRRQAERVKNHADYGAWETHARELFVIMALDYPDAADRSAVEVRQEFRDAREMLVAYLAAAEPPFRRTGPPRPRGSKKAKRP